MSATVVGASVAADGTNTTGHSGHTIYVVNKAGSEGDRTDQDATQSPRSLFPVVVTYTDAGGPLKQTELRKKDN